jgi:hypothetical protein
MRAFDSVVSTYGLGKVAPQIAEEDQWSAGVKLVASTLYPKGSLIGETTGTPGTFGLTITITNVALTSNVATVTTKGPHGLSVGDTVTVTAVTATSINGAGNVVTAVPSTTTFTYAKTTANVTSAADTGTVIRNAGTDTPRAILQHDYATDAAGKIYMGGQASGELGQELDHAPAWFTGIFKGSEIPNLEAVALAAMSGAKILHGTIAAGTHFVKIS